MSTSRSDQIHVRLPSGLSEVVEEEMEEGSFASQAEFIRHLIRQKGIKQ